MEKDEVEIRDDAENWALKAFYIFSQDVLHLCWLHIFLLLINFFRILLSLKQMLVYLISNKVFK